MLYKSLSSSDNYRGISLFNSICKLIDIVLLFVYRPHPNYQHWICNLDIKHDILHYCVLQFYMKL